MKRFKATLIAVVLAAVGFAIHREVHFGPRIPTPLAIMDARLPAVDKANYATYLRTPNRQGRVSYKSLLGKVVTKGGAITLMSPSTNVPYMGVQSSTLTNGGSGTARGQIVIRDNPSQPGYAIFVDRVLTSTRLSICLAGGENGSCINSISVDGTATATFSAGVTVVGPILATSTVRGSSFLNSNNQIILGGGLAFTGDTYVEGNVADSAAQGAVTLTNATAMTAGLDRFITAFSRGASGANIVSKVATDGSYIGGYAPVTRAVSATAPTISSGFGTSPSVATNNGTAAFTINVGTGGVATSGVIGLPTATNGWVCQCDDIAAAVSTSETKMSATSTTSCTVANVNTATGVAVAWAASEILHCTAMGR